MVVIIMSDTAIFKNMSCSLFFWISAPENILLLFVNAEYIRASLSAEPCPS